MRILRIAVLTLLVQLVGCASCEASTSSGTNWQFEVSEAIDVVLFVGILSGDPLATARNPDVIPKWFDQLSPTAHEALVRLDAELRGRCGAHVGPELNHMVTRTPHRTLDSLIAWLEDDAAFTETLEANWQGASRVSRRAVAHDLLIVLQELRKIGFSEHWQNDIAPMIRDRIPALSERVARFDVSSEVSRFLEHPVKQDVTVLLMYYNQPYGIRIVGQHAYVTNYAEGIDVTVRTALHELFHPPFNHSKERIWSATRELRSDPWLRNTVENHDPRFSYNSFEAVLDEDSTRALDQITSERLGLARDPAQRFRTEDGGMHMLAAAIYQAIKETGFAETGGSYEAWLINAVETGILSSDKVRRRAALIVGQDAVDRWNPIQ